MEYLYDRVTAKPSSPYFYATRVPRVTPTSSKMKHKVSCCSPKPGGRGGTESVGATDLYFTILSTPGEDSIT
jgi:hypothetical protein